MSPLKIIFITFCTTSVLFLFSCANQVTPAGGEKDTVPPEIIKESPSNNSTHFKSNSIHLTANEFIQLVNPFENIVSSPPFKNKPKVELKKSRIIQLTIDDELLDNTTYIIQFIGAIKDITEGNKLDLYQYIFSTGENIDSLKIEGEITDVFTKEPVKDAWALLYPFDSEDSVLYKRLPVYIGKTDKSGRFNIKYIKKGKYKLFGLKDENGNLKFDTPTEKIAFSDSAIDIDDTTGYYKLAIFQEENKARKRSIVEADYLGKIVLYLNGENDSPDVELPVQYQIIHQEYNQWNDSLTLWLNKSFTDSILLIRNNDDVDTLRQRVVEIPEISEIKQKYKLGFSTNILQYGHDPENPLILTFNQPMDQFDSSKVILYEDSNIVQTKLGHTVNARRLQIHYKWKNNKEYKLKLQEGAVTSVYDFKNDSIELNFKVIDPEDVASLEVALIVRDSAGTQYVVHLMDVNNKKVVKETITDRSKTVTYKYLSPGKYQIRVIRDENRNKKWDPGNFIEKRQPEKIFYYPEILELKGNWEMEAEIILE